MKVKNFKMSNYKECNLNVSHYLADEKAISIVIIDNSTGEVITKSTVYVQDEKYMVGMATIKNYSENKGMTELFKKLGIITEIFKSKKVNELAEDTETIDFCKINLKKLKEYATEWHYDEREEK